MIDQVLFAYGLVVGMKGIIISSYKFYKARNRKDAKATVARRYMIILFVSSILVIISTFLLR